ncbi:hypothetical protein GCM10027579_12760 [Calidifontibacter terrae]
MTVVAPLRPRPTPGPAALPRTQSWSQPGPAASYTPAADAVPAAPRTAAKGGNGRLWGVAGAVAVVAAGSLAAYAFWPRGAAAADPGAAAGAVTLSAQPALKWQRTMAQIAPSLGCPATTSSDSSSSGSEPTCSVSAVQDGDLTLASVSKSVYDSGTGSSTSTQVFAGVDSSGGTKWTIAVPQGRSFQCVAGTDRLWCLSTADTSSADSGSSGSSTDSSSSGGSDAPPAQLITYGLSDGKQVATIPVTGGSQAVAFAGMSPTAVYVSATPDSGSNTYTLSKISQEGKTSWSRIVAVSPDSALSAQLRSGRLYLVGADSGGRQVILDDATGAPTADAGAGQVVGLVGDTVVSRPVSGGSLSVGKNPVGQSEFAAVWIHDATAPLILGSRSGDTTSWQVVDPAKPAVVKYQLQGSPVAYCGGRLVTSMSDTYYGLDPEDGSIKWTQPGKDVSGLWCSGGSVVLRRGALLVGIDRDKGTEKFQSALPSGQDSSGGDGRAAWLTVAPEITADGIVVSDGKVVTYVR